ncbi:MAG: secD, partial [Solirubrobacteraceae bacterium]|nr:secD [Solirubrobacteraceae bacterium]
RLARRQWAAAGVAGIAAACGAAVLLVVLLPGAHRSERDVVETFRVSGASGERVTASQVAGSVRIMQQRLASLGATGSSVASQGPNTIRFSCAGCRSSTSAAALSVAQTAQLLVYDWEATVLDAHCQSNPVDPNVTGGPAAGQPRSGNSTTYYRAVLRAARCPAGHYALMSHTAPDYYAVDATHGRVLSGPATSSSAALAAARAADPGRAASRATTVDVLPGTTVLEAEYDRHAPSDPNAAQWYVLRDRAVLTGQDIVDPQQGFDTAPGGSGAPIVSFRFTPSGQRAFHAVTRQLARRGQALAKAHQQPEAAFQHFAIALDDRLLTVPFIDFQQNPDGVDGSAGSQIEGGFTIAGARTLASLLKFGALPVRLGLTSVHHG